MNETNSSTKDLAKVCDVTSMMAREKGFPDQWMVATYFNARHNVRRLDERRFDTTGTGQGFVPVCHCDAIIRRR